MLLISTMFILNDDCTEILKDIYEQRRFSIPVKYIIQYPLSMTVEESLNGENVW